jgi:hypothetical protein
MLFHLKERRNPATLYIHNIHPQQSLSSFNLYHLNIAMLAAHDVLVKSIHLSLSIHTFIITFMQYIHPSPFAETSHHFPHLLTPPLGAKPS